MILAIGLSLVIVGIGFLCVSRKSKKNLKNHTAQTTGVVSDEKISYDEDGSPQFYYFSFTYTVEGQEYTTKKIQWVKPNRPQVGDTVSISYNPAKPSDGNATDNEIEPSKSVLIVGWVLIIIGIILIFI